MQGFGKFLGTFFKAVGLVLAAVLVLVLILFGVLGFTNFGARIVTDRVASALSNRDMTIAIDSPSALLTGGLQAARISLSDTRGVFAQIDGLAIDWIPTALLTARFHATRVEAQRISYLRAPLRTLPAAPNQEGSGFSLPIRVDIDTISLPAIQIADAVAGRSLDLSAGGKLSADSNGGSGTVQISRRAVPDAKLAADFAYMPAQNQLRINAELAEPKGGLLAEALALPGSPAVKIDLRGDGPLTDWKGRLQAALDGQQRAALDAHHTLTADNLHHLDLKGGGDVASLLPAPFRPLFAGQTNVDISTAFDNNGKIDIQTGNIATGSVVIAASGTIDPRGKNNLNANVLGTAGPVDFRWPLAEGEARLMISGLNLALTGDAKAARLSGNVSLDSASLPQADIGSTKLTVKSDNFNLASTSGPVQLRLVASDADVKNADINRLLQGSVNLGSTLQVSADSIGFNGTTLDTGSAHAKVNGTYQQTSGALNGNLKISIDPPGLPPALASRLSKPVDLESQVAGTLPSKITLSNLKLTSDLIEAAGNVSLDNQVLDTSLSGRVIDLSKLVANGKGELRYAIDAKGELPRLALTANLTSDRLDMAGRPVSGLQVDLSGDLDQANSAVRLTAKGAIDNQPIAINGNGSYANGAITVPEIDATVGSNRLTGNLALDAAFQPSGAFSFDLPDISLIAALAAQKASGDLKGAIDIANADNKIKLDVKATGNALGTGSLTIRKPDIALAVTDLKAFAANGTIKADEVAIPASRLVTPVVTLNQTGTRTNFDLTGTYDDAPLQAAGSAEVGAETLLTLDRFSARPRGIPVELGMPAHARFAANGLQLDRFTLRTGDGSVDVAGSIGQALDLKADIQALPASLADNFVRNLAAEGTISGTATVTGQPAAPIGNIVLAWNNAATSQTRQAGLGPLAIDANGKLAGDRLVFSASAVSGRTVSLKADGTYDTGGPNAGLVAAKADIVNLPAELANSFVANLDAQGELSGTVTANGKLPSPTVDFTLALKNASTAQTKAAALSDLSMTSSGKLENNNLTFDAKVLASGGLDLAATGTYALAGPSAKTLVVDGTIANLPAALANPFVPSLEAGGFVSGTVRASGQLPRPATDFDLTWKQAATQQTRAAKLGDATLIAKGRFADNRLDANAALTLAEGGGLTTTAQAELDNNTLRSAKADARLDRIPAALANAFVQNLDAAGAISGALSASGTLEQPQATFDLAWADAQTSQTRSARLSPLSVKASGKLDNGQLQFNAGANNGSATNLQANGTARVEGTAVKDIQANARLEAVPASLLNAFRPDLDAAGTISATATIAGALPRPSVDFTLNWADATTAQTKKAGLSVLQLKANGKFADNAVAFDADLAEAERSLLKANGAISLANNAIGDLQINADIAGIPASIANGFVPGLGAEGVITGQARTSGTPEEPVVDFDLDWKDAATSQTRKAGLKTVGATASGRLEKGRVTFKTDVTGDGVAISGNGDVAIAGTEPKAVNAQVTIQNLPAGLANGFVPNLDAGGVISGKATANGTLPIPNVQFDLDWKNAATSQTRAAGIGALAAQASGQLTDGKLNFDAALSGTGVSLKADGSYVLTGDAAQTLDIRANLANIPAGIANGFVPGIGAEGTISGSATAKGKLPFPNAEFKLNWKNAATSQTKSAGLAGVTITADGRLADNQLNFNTTLAGQQGLNFKGGGTVGLTGQRPLDLRVNGILPFAVLGAQLSAQGLVATGSARLDLSIGGTAAAPSINGNVSTSGAKIVDVRRNLALNNIQGNIDFNGRQASITRLTGQFGSGGSIAASGTVGIDPGAGFPADIQVKLNRAVYVDGTLIVATVDGALGLKGPITSNPTLSGQLRLDKTSITVPAKLPSSLQKLRIKHVAAPPAVRAQLRETTPQAPSSKSSTINLDITLDAPSQIFVRGRGIDAELGGRIGIKGTAAAPEVTGGFTMRRGRLTILNRRLNFTDKSRITFAGDLTPALNLEASSASGSTTLTVDVAGVATDPDITFSSSPALPQDEVLAQLIFGQSMSKLSPVQIAQLADAVSQLAGGRATSLFEGLRNQLGVDDLDVSTDAQGRTSVSVGRYLNERTYFELQQSEDGPKAVINLDVGRGVKLRAGAGGAGSGEAGVVYEREY